MGLIRDARGQSVVIGSLLIFTILILAFSGYQAFAVPDQNAEVEIDHFQENEDRFSEFRSNIVIAVGTEETRSTVFDLGARYPSRIAALNPPPAAGRLETTNSGNVSIEESSGSVDDLCSESTSPTTRSLVYTPGYNEYREARAIGHESRVISREYDGGTIYDQRLVRGNNIDLVLLNGTVSENGLDAYSLEIDGSNRKTETLDNPNITIPSRFDNATWEKDIFADRSNVTAAPATGDRVKLNFTGDYRVSCAVVGLDGDPAFSPPSDVDTGTDGDAAYSTEWFNSSSEPGTSSCSDEDCTLNATVSRTLDLTAGTTPAAQDATVSFSVSNSTVGTVAPAANETDSKGNASTRLEAGSNGTVKVYAASGGSGDVINVTVEDLIPFRGAVFTDGTDGTENVTTANSTGTNTLAAEASVLGPLVASINNDGTNDIPYVPSGGSKVHIVDRYGDVTELSSNDAFSPSLLGVGRWDGNMLSVYFASGDKSTIYRTNPSEGDIGVVKPDNEVFAVAGPADIDDDDDANELVYADGNQELRYFDPEAGPGVAEGKLIYDDIGSKNSLGRPADFNGDGTARIPVVDGSGNLLLVDSDGNGPELATGVDKAPVAAVDWDEDGELEVMYLEGGELKYVYDIGSPTEDTTTTGITEPRGKTGVT